MLDSLDGVTSVHAPFYELSSLFHQVCQSDIVVEVVMVVVNVQFIVC